MRIGDEVDLSTKKTGVGAKGDWMMIPVMFKGHRELTLWVRNVAEAKNFTSAKIKTIESIMTKRAQSQDGKWYTDVSANVTLEGSDSNASTKSAAFNDFMEFVQAGSPTEDEIPFA